MDISNGFTLPMVIASSFSVIGSIIIIAGYWKKHRRGRKSIYDDITLYMGISCLFNAAGTMMGEPKDGSAECWFMGIDTNIFSLSAMFWTAYLTYTLHCISRSKNDISVYAQRASLLVHGVCWGIPIAVTLLPLITLTIGSPDRGGWCWFVATEDTPRWHMIFWYWCSYYLWVWCCICASIYFLVSAQRDMVKSCTSQRSIAAAEKATRRLRWYCLVILLCWTTPTVFDTVFIFVDPPRTQSMFYLGCTSATLASMQGFFTGLVYFFSQKHRRSAVMHQVYIEPVDMSAVSTRESTITAKAVAIQDSPDPFVIADGTQ